MNNTMNHKISINDFLKKKNVYVSPHILMGLFLLSLQEHYKLCILTHVMSGGKIFCPNSVSFYCSYYFFCGTET